MGKKSEDLLQYLTVLSLILSALGNDLSPQHSADFP